MHAICVYCGSREGADPAYLAAARTFGEAVAARAMTLIYGGASVGLMNAAADAALGAGARVVGIIPERLMRAEVARSDLSELHIVQSMHERKKLMADYADAFVALPGGIGTLEELFETWTWRQLGYHNKPLGLLNVQGFFDPMLDFLAQTHEQGFVSAETLATLVIDDDPVRLLERLSGAQPLAADPWWQMRETV